ncbi:MAG: FKBP-type peptidyl-prolyl cis-trans isomerase [Chlamydiae bacterium]|nr:FKBP-type peptidyl-prolyl cis-trans isomerase [Chlamydiota bacterium]
MNHLFFKIFSIALSLLFLHQSCFAEEEKSQNPEISKISEAFGHLIGKNIDAVGINFDLEAVVKGLKDASQGKTSPMSEVECIQAISAAQEITYKKQAQDNLKKAEEFLEKNGKEKDIVMLEEGKLQYKIEKQGLENQVKPNFSPLIRYVGRYLDGSIFGKSSEGEVIPLNEDTILCFKKGLVGMKEGEKRILYVHPDLGYGTSGYLPPNSLLIFEVELIKANAPKSLKKSSLSLNPTKDDLPEEIAESDYGLESIR